MAQAITMVLPATLAQNGAAPLAALALEAPWLDELTGRCGIAGAALVGALLAAFGAVFDARLYVSLNAPERAARATLMLR